MREDLSGGLCRDSDHELFIHEHTSAASSCDLCFAAKQVCKQCPVRAACLREGLSLPAGMQWGVWGGWTARERKKFKKDQAKRSKGT